MDQPTNEPHERALLRSYVSDGKLMQLATISASGAPWLAHCWYATDSDLNLIFMSKADRRHSTNIRDDERVAGGIIAMTLDGLGQKVRGVSFEGTAEQVDEGRLSPAYETYSARWPQVGAMVSVDEISRQATDNRLWRVVPSMYVLFDEVNFPDSPRRELLRW
jgi:uncharacterized protein YhbP (UPF0306 family)